MSTDEVDRQAAFEKANAVKQAHSDELMAKPNVVGVGVGFRSRGGQPTDSVAIVVMVDRKLPSEQLAPDETIPSEIEGVPVDVQEVGRLSAQ